jgi:cellulose synthase/poly-beta-1,6-N-acetylglucosamine synthase-like glycosyltransferase
MSESKRNIHQYYSDLAEQCQMDFVKVNYSDIDPELLQKDDRNDYLKLQAVPINQTPTTITIGTAHPIDTNLEKINLFWANKTEKKIKIVLISRQNISQILGQRFEKELTHDITFKRYDMDPVHSASYSFDLKEKIIILIILFSIFAGLYWQFYITVFVISLFLSMGTLVIMTYKLGLTVRLLRWPQNKPVQYTVLDAQLPVYTILIPLLREKEETLKVLFESLARLDYPTEKLDIKLLLEKSDLETLEIINKYDLPWIYDVLIVPPGLPRSKPRACNYGLYLAYGEYLTIYDAEDRPDPDQLKQALKCFKENDEPTVCIQAALNFYNYKENLLTRLFTIEYSHWFDSFVPALVFLKAPVPLGGTSNHFKIYILYQLGGWDPYIGTEDAEIGIRIYRHGYKTNCIVSTTYEEANSHLYNWFKQRARWNKGYMQTYLVNMRDPIKLYKQLGLVKFIHFQYFVGGNVFIQLANLPLWFFLLAGYFHYVHIGFEPYPKILFFMTWFNFLVSNLLLLLSEFYATWKRGLYDLLPYVPLKIFYWLLMSFAGYYAIFELLKRPGYWYKTEHGISNQGNDTDIPINR